MRATALLDSLFQGGGVLSRLGLGAGGAGGGILAAQTGVLQARLTSIKAAPTAMAKVQALTGTLGMRLKSLGRGTSADWSYQVGAATRSQAGPVPPESGQFR